MRSSRKTCDIAAKIKSFGDQKMRSRPQFPSVLCEHRSKFLAAAALAIGFAAHTASAANKVYEGPGADLASNVWGISLAGPDGAPGAFNTNDTMLFENVSTFPDASSTPTVGSTISIRYLNFDTGASAYTIGGTGTLSVGNGISSGNGDVALQADNSAAEEIDANVLMNGTGGSNATKDSRRGIRLTNSSSLTITSPVVIAQGYMIENPDATSTLRLTTGFSNTKAGSVYDTGAGTVILGSTDLGWTGNYYVGELKAGAGSPGQNLTTGNGTTRVTSDTSFGGAPFAELLTTDGKIELANGNAGGLNTHLDVRGRADATTVDLTSLTGTSDVYSNTFESESGGTGSNYILEAQASSTLTFSPTSKVSNGSGVASTLNLVGAGAGVMNGLISEDNGSWSVVKSGGGSWTIGGTQNYTGPTDIQGGKLLIDGTTTTVGQITVENGATLGGHGNIVATIVVLPGGTYAPGNSVATQTITGNLAVGGTLAIEYEGVGAGDNIDRTDVSGVFDLSTASLNFTDVGGGDPLDLNAYVFASYGTLIGAPIPTGVPAGYHVDYHYNDGVSSNHIALVLPEPSVLSAAALGLVALKRRRR